MDRYVSKNPSSSSNCWAFLQGNHLGWPHNACAQIRLPLWSHLGWPHNACAQIGLQVPLAPFGLASGPCSRLGWQDIDGAQIWLQDLHALTIRTAKRLESVEKTVNNLDFSWCTPLPRTGPFPGGISAPNHGRRTIQYNI